MIGETVLFQIAPGIYRPMILVSKSPASMTYSGEVFFDFETDWGEDVRRRLPCKPTQMQRSFWVKAVGEGKEVWEWKRLQAPNAAPVPLRRAK